MKQHKQQRICNQAWQRVNLHISRNSELPHSYTNRRYTNKFNMLLPEKTDTLYLNQQTNLII